MHSPGPSGLVQRLQQVQDRHFLAHDSNIRPAPGLDRVRFHQVCMLTRSQRQDPYTSSGHALDMVLMPGAERLATHGCVQAQSLLRLAVVASRSSCTDAMLGQLRRE